MGAPGRLYRPFLLAILFLSLYLSYIILRPFLHTIILAIILVLFFHPVHTRVVKAYRGRRNAASLSVAAMIIFLILIPVLFLSSALVKQGLESLDQISDWIRAGNIEKVLAHPKVSAFINWFRQHLHFIELSNQDLQTHLLQISKTFGQFLFAHGAGLLKNVASLISHFFIMVFIIFYFLRDGDKMVTRVKYLSPLREEQEDRILSRITAVARSAFLGNFLTALCQGAVGGIGFVLVGIPGLFWGTLMGFCSLIPVVGTALVWVPAVGYLTILGKWKASVFLGLWCLLAVGLVDNVLRPFLMRGEGKISPFYMFLAIIGGVQYFGLVGVLYGPLILGFAMVMLYVYQVEYKDVLDNREEEPGARAGTNGA
jgi:predicted PurR-regulated permease PerM